MTKSALDWDQSVQVHTIRTTTYAPDPSRVRFFYGKEGIYIQKTEIAPGAGGGGGEDLGALRQRCDELAAERNWDKIDPICQEVLANPSLANAERAEWLRLWAYWSYQETLTGGRVLYARARGFLADAILLAKEDPSCLLGFMSLRPPSATVRPWSGLHAGSGGFVWHIRRGSNPTSELCTSTCPTRPATGWVGWGVLS